MTTVYRYRLWCIDEEAFVYSYGTTPPTTCPNNTNHSINPDSISILAQYSNAPLEVKIKEESVPTNKNIKELTVPIVIPTSSPNTITTITIPWKKYQTSIKKITFTSTADHEGDIIDAYMARYVPIGTLAADAASGSTVFSVPPDTLTYINVGHEITLVSSNGTNELGTVLAIDTAAQTITTEQASTIAYTANTTVIQLSVHPIENYEIGPPSLMSWGGNNSSMAVPPNTTITVNYRNISGAAKRLIFVMECLY